MKNTTPEDQIKRSRMESMNKNGEVISDVKKKPILSYAEVAKKRENIKHRDSKEDSQEMRKSIKEMNPKERYDYFSKDRGKIFRFDVKPWMPTFEIDLLIEKKLRPLTQVWSKTKITDIESKKTWRQASKIMIIATKVLKSYDTRKVDYDGTSVEDVIKVSAALRRTERFDQRIQKMLEQTKSPQKNIKNHAQAYLRKVEKKFKGKVKTIEQVRFFTKSKISTLKKRVAYLNEKKRRDRIRMRFRSKPSLKSLVDTTPLDIEIDKSEIEKYLIDLFSKKDCEVPEPESLLNKWVEYSKNTTSIDEDSKPNFNEEIFNECLKWSRSWKAPGTNKLYMKIFKVLNSCKIFLMEWIKAVYERRCNLTDEDTRGRAFGIFKKGNIDDPKNYRFINVTNSHYKIFMKYLNSVIVDQIEHRIPKEQIANKKGRSCLDGIIINRLIQKKTVHGQQIAQTWLDMQKAYDSLDHKKLLIVLENLGIHRDFIEIIKKAMRCWKFTVINGKETYMNNEKKKKKPTVIHVNRGIYQGDSLSPTLFVCSLIPLSWMLNQQPRINLEDPNTEANVVTTMNDDEVEDEGLYNHLLFMDDIKLFSINAKCLNEMTKICEKYGLEIGLKINPLKSSYSINQGEQAEEPLINFEELSTVYKYLGIYENHKTADEKANLQDLYKVVDEKLKLILESPITVGNMIDAINTCLMPKILYVFSHERSELIKRKIYLDMDLRIRKALNTYGVKFQNLSNARIYLPRSRFGLGLKSTETEIDKIQLKNFIHIKYSEVFRKMNETFKMMENDIIIIASKYNINMSFEEGLPCINGTIGSEKEAKKKISELVDNFAYKRWAEHYTRKKEFPKFVINNKLICPWLRTLNIEPRKFKTITMTQDDMHPMLNPIFDKESKCVLETNSVKCNHYDNIRHVGSYCEHSVSWRRRRHDNVLHTITNVLLRKLKQKMVDLNNYKKCYKIDDNTELRIDQLNYTSESLVHNKPDIIYETKDKIIIGELAISHYRNLEESAKLKIQRYTVNGTLQLNAPVENLEYSTNFTAVLAKQKGKPVSFYPLICGPFGELDGPRLDHWVAFLDEFNISEKETIKPVIERITRKAAIETEYILFQYIKLKEKKLKENNDEQNDMEL
uniref:Reverse transcriptase domain-containing protein n=1 Tax=Strongyloides papillosus TaxID=174720 RepID=A0A0N5BJA6_STREA